MSELKSILLHLDASAQTGQRLRLARLLAAPHAARIEAMYAVMPAVVQYPIAFSVDSQGAALMVKYESEQRDRIKLAFEHESRRPAPSPAEACAVTWHESADDPVRAFTQRAWGADMLVLAQHDPSPQSYSGVTPDFAAAVLIQSGKPGVVMPYIGAGAEFGNKVLLAWKATPESARAVTAALPILQRAREVHLAVWDEPGNTSAAAAIEPYLRHHGITPTVHHGGLPTRELGDLLLSLAADIQADLLVMGCYGHGRAREWVLGGVTRTVLRSMTLPVLMVH